MKKFLRFLLILIIVIVAAVLIIGLVEPTDITVQRSGMINAPRSVVFNQIQMFKNWPHWSPWYKIDTTMSITYSGNDGTQGSSYHWAGNNKVGEGTMTNEGVGNVSNADSLRYKLEFIKPFKGEAAGYLKAEDSAGMTKVTWSFSAHHSYPMNAMMMFVNMDKMLGGDFEHGIANLKKYAESNAGSMSGSADVKEVQYPGRTVIGLRKTISMNDIGKLFGDDYKALAKSLGGSINGPGIGIYYSWDTINHRTDMMAGFCVADGVKAVKGTTLTKIPASRAYMVMYKGPYMKMGDAHMALAKYVVSKGKHQDMVIEEYVAGPGTEPDSTRWVTNIYYLVK